MPISSSADTAGCPTFASSIVATAAEVASVAFEFSDSLLSFEQPTANAGISASAAIRHKVFLILLYFIVY